VLVPYLPYSIHKQFPPRLYSFGPSKLKQTRTTGSLFDLAHYTRRSVITHCDWICKLNSDRLTN